MVKLYHQTGSAVRARRRFMREGNRRQGPSERTIIRLAVQFRATDSVVEVRRTQRLSACIQVKMIRRAIVCKPNLSVRRLAQRMGVPRSTVNRVLGGWDCTHTGCSVCTV